MDRKKAAQKRDRITEGTVVTGEMDRKKAAQKRDRITLNTSVSSLDAQKSVLIDETETSNYFMR